MCLDHSAHGVVSTHEIFRKPYPVELDWETIPTPANYRKFYNGRDLGPQMKTWRVQATGYVDDKNMQPGVVAASWGFADAPDGEFIAGGLNTKGPKYVALGRHGPFFQWGFSAPPSQMTPSGRRAFVNAICYISQFDRQPPLTRKGGAPSRGWALDHAMSLTKMEQRYERLVASYARRAEQRAKAEAVKEANSRPLTDKEKWALKYPKSNPMPWDQYRYMLLRGYPEELRERLGTEPQDLKKYLPYYEKNLDYLIRAQRGYAVDEDAKALGVSNRDPRILDKAVQMLDSDNDEDAELAQRLLQRYTDQRFEKSADWRAWLERERSELFFSDVGGYRFYSRRRGSDLQRTMLEKQRGDARPNAKQPVVFDVVVLGTPTPGGMVTVGARLRIANGFHVYASAPDASPYPVTKLALELPKGATAVGEWNRPNAVPAGEDAGLTHYVGNAVFLRDIRLDRTFQVGSRLAVTATWQACDAHICLPPAQQRRTAALGK